MKVSEAIALLQEFDPDTEVILSKDAEGNSYSPMADSYSNGVYVPDTTWSGEFYSERNPDEDAQEDVDDYEDAKSNPDAVEAICLWPIN